MVLLPEVVRTVNLPVVGAGGFADGASLAAALALGAIGVQMGTRFIATQEGDFEQMWKEQLVKATEFDTIVGRGIFGPMRFLINRASLEVIDETIKGASDLYRGKPCPSTDEIRKLEESARALGLEERILIENASSNLLHVIVHNTEIGIQRLL